MQTEMVAIYEMDLSGCIRASLKTFAEKNPWDPQEKKTDPSISVGIFVFPEVFGLPKGSTCTVYFT